MRLTLADNGLASGLHLALELAGVAASRYGFAPAAGLAARQRRVDLGEHSIRCVGGDPDLAEALRRDAEDDWE